MDSHQFFGYRASAADLSYSSSHSTVPSIPTRLFGSLKFDSRNSPNSPFSTHFDSETYYSSTENILCASPSCNSSLDSSCCYQRLSPSLDCHQGSSLLCCSGGTFSQNATSGCSINHALLELETVLMGPDDVEEVITPSSSLGEHTWPQTLELRSRGSSQEPGQTHMIQPQQSFVMRYGNPEDELCKRYNSLPGAPPGNLKELLMACARALAENELDNFEKLIQKARGAVSISGTPIQRLGAYMVEGLIAKKEESGNNIYRALRCREPEGEDLLSYMHILYEICPYLKFGYMAANGAIAEACRNEDRIHIVDYQIAQGTQWMTLLQALAARPRGAPYVKITGIDDPFSKYARGDSLEAVGIQLAAISKKFKIPVEFHPMPVYASDVTKDMLDVRPGEALVVNFPLQLHHTPDESVDVNNPRDKLLRMVKSLSPKVVTLVEQESNTNTATFLSRFEEALGYYSAMFESIDVTLGRDRKERINVEMHCLARDIVNIVACEGRERVERHELLGKWRSRFMMAGFRQYPLSSYVNSVIGSLLRCYSEYYTLVEKDGAMLLGWKERNLISASAWQ
ncbi:hypothetical protein LguiA_035578 [Lonicera macranthoides]